MEHRTCSQCNGSGKERHGTNTGPIDWSHEFVADAPEHWKQAAENPEGWRLDTGVTSVEIVEFGMYDGWPYWQPVPSVLYKTWMGYEWRCLRGLSHSAIYRPKKNDK